MIAGIVDAWSPNVFKVPLGEPRMFYLGIDQHAKQLTLSLRDADGNVVFNRQVSTEPTRCSEFFAKLHEKSAPDGYTAIVEVCGFNDWLLDFVPQHGCSQVILIVAPSNCSPWSIRP